jgi:hypothetical protein
MRSLWRKELWRRLTRTGQSGSEEKRCSNAVAGVYRRVRLEGAPDSHDDHILANLLHGLLFLPGSTGQSASASGFKSALLAFIYLASMFFRELGVRYAKQFWNERNGLPSTRFGRMRDPFLSAEQKIRIQLAVRHKFGIRLMSLEEDGAEYGFARNLCGARMIFVVQAIGGIVICGFKGRLHWTFTPGCGINLILLALWVPFAWLILPRMLMLSAEAYAGRAWITFLSLAERSYKKPSSSLSPQADHRCVSGK